MPRVYWNSNRFVFGSVRNPWDWYVSLWAFGCSKQGGLAHRLTSPPRLRDHGYRAAPLAALRSLLHEPLRKSGPWQQVYADVNNPALFRRWLIMLADPHMQRDAGDRFADSPMAGFGGYMTYRYLSLFCRDLKTLYGSAVRTARGLRDFVEREFLPRQMVRTENLAQDLLQVLRRCDIALTPQQEQTILTVQAMNPSTRKRGLDFFYDQTTADLVARRDALIIERHGYPVPDL